MGPAAGTGRFSTSIGVSVVPATAGGAALVGAGFWAICGTEKGVRSISVCAGGSVARLATSVEFGLGVVTVVAGGSLGRGGVSGIGGVAGGGGLARTLIVLVRGRKYDWIFCDAESGRSITVVV